MVAGLVGAALLAACASNGASPLPNAGGGSGLSPALRLSANPTQAQIGLWPRPGHAQRVCSAAPAGVMRCAAWVRTDMKPLFGVQGKRSAVSGYGPSDLQTAYGLTSLSGSNGSGVTVAIVDAYVDSKIASDLAVYRSQYGLPAANCTSGNPCFTAHALGSRTNSGWGEEESLDVDMVSAICPHCNILLVEAASASTTALDAAEQYATQHANYVSNSWSGNETSSTSYDSYYTVAGKVITAATGDSGYNSTAQWPAIIPSVVAVGGTSLTKTSPRAESAWSGAGSGCSKYYAKPSWQTMNTGCSKRAQSDVSANADPNTGVAVYDSFHETGWMVFGGTSEATPITASVFALSGNTGGNATLYANASKLYDITSGSNGSCGAPLCTAGTGWDGPTGLGAPIGDSAY
jgi:subtilase family serine protease